MDKLFKQMKQILADDIAKSARYTPLSYRQKEVPMGRLESINKRFNQYDFVHSYIDDNSCNQEWDEAHKAMGYLLQRLERYEKALGAIVNYDDGIIRQYEEVGELCSIYENIAKEALKE